MTQLITPNELEDLSETELRSKFCQVLHDLARSQKCAAQAPLQMISLENIRCELIRRRLQGPKP